MLLKSRYILLVNLVIFVTMTVFFIVDDVRLQRTHTEALTRGTQYGVRADILATRVYLDIQGMVGPDRPTSELQNDVQTMEVGDDVLDIRVTTEVREPTVVASLREKANGTTLSFTPAERRQLGTINARDFESGKPRMFFSIVKHDDEWALRVVTPYLWSAEGTFDHGYNARYGLIEILLDAREVPTFWQSHRPIHLLFIILVSMALTIFVDMATNRMVLRPLERLTEIIRNAEEGRIETHARFPDNEVGRVSATLTNMLRTMRRLHNERVTALERLASGVAHEIRNPLNAISLSTQYLKDLFASDKTTKSQREEAREMLDIVLGEVKELNRITNQFLNLTRPPRMERTPEDLNLLLDKTLSEFFLTCKEKDIQILRNFDPDLPLVAVDIVRMRTAFYNLIQNAIQAMQDGGSLDITTRAETDCVFIAIKDTGKGMSKDVLERVFDPYFTTREKEGGLGLGLTLAQQAVLAHDGTIEVSSREQDGTTFRIMLPKRGKDG